MRAFIPGWRATRLLAVAATVALGLGATKGSGAGNYTATDSTVYSFVDISGGSGGASVLSGTDDGTVALTLPFPFRFFGQPYTIVCASSNGAIYFVTVATACNGFSDFANVDLTTATTPNDLPAALPLWSDLSFQAAGGGSVFYQTIGVPGSRRFVVQWQNAFPSDSQSPVTFQALLLETSHKLVFQYRSVDLGAGNAASLGGLATVGIRNRQAVTSQEQIEWSYNAKVIGDSTAIEFSTAINAVAGDVDGDGLVTCTDLNIVKASVGKRAGQPGFDPRADVNRDGIVNLLDAAFISRLLPAGIQC